MAEQIYTLLQESLPLLPDVILKVKNRQELTPAEEFVYLVCIEELKQEDALKIIQDKFEEENGE